MSSALSCPECSTTFAFDQRYCVQCGHRLRPLPRTVAVTLATMSAPHRDGAARLDPSPFTSAEPSTPTGRGPSVTLLGSRVEVPSPRAMVLAVLMVLAFGVIITSGSSSLASSLLLTFNRPISAAPATTPPVPVSPSANTGGSGPTSPAPAPAPASTSSASTASSSSSSVSTATTAGTTTSPGAAAGLPPIEHVWVIDLGDQGYAQTFDNTSSDTYLNSTLAKQGEVVPFVYASATSDLANEVGLVSGQGPTVQTEADCPKYAAITPGSTARGQVHGSGCVYPKSTASLMSELTTAGFTWKSYVQGLGATPAGGCAHPTLGAKDRFYSARAADSYVTWRNPVVYLAGLTSLASCGSDDTGMGALPGDLKTVKSTPNVSFILPNTCDDGTDIPCHTGAADGTKRSDAFLKSIVPKIMASPAYKQDGMILVTFAQAPQSGPGADHSSCCDAPTKFPNLPSANYVPPTATTTGTGTTPGATGTTSAAGTTDTSTTGTTGTTGTVCPTVTGTTTTVPGTGPTTSNTTGTDTTATTCVCPGATDTTTGTDTTASGTDTSTTATTDCTVCPSTTGTTTGTDTTTSTAATTTTDTTGTDTTATTCVCPTTTATTTTGTDTTTSTAATTTTDTTETTETDTSAAPADCTGTGTGTTTTPISLGPGIPTGGGGQVGLLVLSQYVTKNLQDGTDGFSTFSITASLEQLFGLKYTGYAATSGLPLFSGFFYSNYNDG